MKKILYLCPVDWQWIKQRPQFLAEELSEAYEIHALYPYQNNRGGLQEKQPTPVNLIPCRSLPTLGGKLGFLNPVNRFWARAQAAAALNRVKPDYLWVTMPWQLDWLPNDPNIPILYDCMDDYAAITADPTGREELLRQEKALVDRAERIFASSGNLRELLVRRHGAAPEKITLLRNGYNAKWTEQPRRKPISDGVLRIGYFGTVGRWFDFPLLLDALEALPQVEFHLYGPAERGVKIPEHPRLRCYGVIAHGEIPEKAAALDGLMMPFVPNDIVKSVDPVKLYEYIYLHKNILCVRYPEIHRFAPFVLFYDTSEEFQNRLKQLMADPAVTYTKENANTFLLRNSWRVRASEVHAVIQNI